MSATSGTLWWLPRILEDETLDPTSTLIMVALADHVNGEDWCYCGIKSLAKRARVSYATTRRRLTELEKSGRITRSRMRRDDGNLSVYTYRLERSAIPVAAEPALNLSADQRSPRRALTSAHPGERAELPHVEPPHKEGVADATPLFLVANANEQRDDVEALCTHLADRIEKRSPTRARPLVTAKWRKDMRLLVERGELNNEHAAPLSPAKIRASIDAVFDLLAEPNGNGFCWAKQINSPGALRSKWTRLADEVHTILNPQTHERKITVI